MCGKETSHPVGQRGKESQRKLETRDKQKWEYNMPNHGILLRYCSHGFYNVNTCNKQNFELIT